MLSGVSLIARAKRGAVWFSVETRSLHVQREETRPSSHYIRNLPAETNLAPQTDPSRWVFHQDGWIRIIVFGTNVMVL
ncbi:hypothetical protein MJO28_011107 [Puccinia striiformis f. sp. tritici]|uniref:Uncharacterized protein n=1 Tax=Puccinia striiformis f. sp. tritici TaxID=168172 RepID=A0ACC0E371_9BASI|nr:hypothetical protein MJO28_011107 [Puccinia striiformis f. sp. tritici]